MLPHLGSDAGWGMNVPGLFHQKVGYQVTAGSQATPGAPCMHSRTTAHPLPAAPCTDHNGVVVGTANPQHHSRAQVLGPPLRQDCLPFVPHPANKAPELSILAHVVEAGGDWHVQGGPRLGEKGQVRSSPLAP